ncbi:MAG: peptidase M42 [Planctomycetia bacterium]|nr:peptidase M42 [Planctomycetia bacterium]MBL6914613.1 peptidase M42 [Planctomycetota bacterium]MDA9265002.1 peptidase M42 [Planctomycetota bacterium]MDC3251957.1 peptidase M42 [Planctomycetota bacterium]
MSEKSTPWQQSMPEDQFTRMRDILAAPSPVGLEAAMTEGVLAPMCESFMPESWKIHRFKGNAGIVLDTYPDAPEGTLTVMAIGHADKIRMQVRSIGDDGKIWINSDSFLPTTLIGHEVTLFSEDPNNPGKFRSITGGTVEALGAIHFAEPALRDGSRGIKANQIYLELQLSGDERKKQVESLGIRSGDPILLDRPIRKGFGPDSFVGAYLDNGLGCFVVEEAARLIAEGDRLENIRYLAAFAAYEEIGRFGSRVFAGEMKPDVIIGVDVNHDYDAAPGIGDRRYTPLKMGSGMTLSVGAIATSSLNAMIQNACKEKDIPFQVDVCGRDTGTDAMAGVLASVDAAATSVGFPIRNMHTISESAHTGDVLAAIYALEASLRHMDSNGVCADQLRSSHPRLDHTDSVSHGQ